MELKSPWSRETDIIYYYFSTVSSSARLQPVVSNIQCQNVVRFNPFIDVLTFLFYKCLKFELSLVLKSFWSIRANVCEDIFQSDLASAGLLLLCLGYIQTCASNSCASGVAYNALVFSTCSYSYFPLQYTSRAAMEVLLLQKKPAGLALFQV